MNCEGYEDQTNRVSVPASRSYRTPNSFLLVAPSRLLSHEWDSFRLLSPFCIRELPLSRPCKSHVASLRFRGDRGSQIRRNCLNCSLDIPSLDSARPLLYHVLREPKLAVLLAPDRRVPLGCIPNLRSVVLSRHALRFPTSPRPSRRIRPRMYEQFGRVRSIWPELSGTNR